jgi:hypothetical protein
VHRSLIKGGAIVSLLWVVYFVAVAALVPGQLRQAAKRVGLKLEVGSVRSLYPGELRIRNVELELLSVGAIVSAREVVITPSWRALFSSAPLLESARASHVALRWASGSLGPLEARVRKPAVPNRNLDDGVLEVEGAGARWQTTARAATLTLRGSVELRHDEFEPGESARLVLGDGVIDVSDIAVVETSRGPALGAASAGRLGMHAMLRVENALLDAARVFEVAGRLYVRGDDAGIWLDLAGAPESVRWMLSELEGQPFEIEASLRACPTAVAFDGVRFQSGLMVGTGALRRAAEGWSGALQLRRGSFSLGISIAPGDVQTLLSPEPFWLDAERARLRDACFAGGL